MRPCERGIGTVSLLYRHGVLSSSLLLLLLLDHHGWLICKWLMAAPQGMLRGCWLI